jgi:hypothetical protein
MQRRFYVTVVALLSLWVLLGSASLLHRLVVGKEKLVLAPQERLLPSETVQVRILNACGYPGAAQRLMQYLRRYGVDVVEIGTMAELMPRSCVWDHVGAPRYARSIARLVGIPDSLVQTRLDSSLFLHCSVVLGLDVLRLEPFARR